MKTTISHYTWGKKRSWCFVLCKSWKKLRKVKQTREDNHLCIVTVRLKSNFKFSIFSNRNFSENSMFGQKVPPIRFSINSLRRKFKWRSFFPIFYTSTFVKKTSKLSQTDKTRQLHLCLSCGRYSEPDPTLKRWSVAFWRQKILHQN